MAWDSAARISELLDINIGHVNFDRYGAVISVSGKTGRRNIRLVELSTGPSSLDQYPPSQRQPGRPALCHLPEAWEHVSIPAHRAPGAEHLCPAGRSCRLSKGHQSPRIPARASYNPGQAAYRVRLREYAGWSKGSSMAQVYVHLSSRDIDNKILAVDGVKPEEERRRTRWQRRYAPGARNRTPRTQCTATDAAWPLMMKHWIRSPLYKISMRIRTLMRSTRYG